MCSCRGRCSPRGLIDAMTGRRRKGRDLTPEEQELWHQAMRDARPVKRTAAIRLRPRQSERRDTDARSAAETPQQAAPGLTGLDRQSAMRLRRGRWPIDGRIDLHGMTLRQAEDALERYLNRAAASGKRCILVISGKGAPPPMPHERDFMPDKPRPGAIRGALPRWLTEGAAARHVLAFCPARARHGGAGALYVLLRRRRGQ